MRDRHIFPATWPPAADPHNSTDKIPECEPCRTKIKMAVTRKKLLPVAPQKVEPALRDQYPYLSHSDLMCLVRLYEQGLLEVSLDRESRDLVLTPSDTVATFVDAVFGLDG